MNDIIAAQQVQRRSKPSLLSSAQQYRGIVDNPVVADQHLPKRKKKSLLEVIREKSAAGKSAGSAQDGPELLQNQQVSRGLASQKRASEKRIAQKGGTRHRASENPVSRASAQKQAAGKAPGMFDFSGVFKAAGTWFKGTGPGKIRLAKTRFVKTGLTHINKKVLVGLRACLSVLCCAFSFDYIPDPEPPEDSVIREQQSFPVRPVSGDEIPLDMTEVFAWQNYTVEPGDAVETIARRYDLSMDAVIASNNLRNVRRLQAGQTIRIPNMDGIPYTVKNGDSYVQIAASFEVPLEAVLDANDIQSDDINAGLVLFIPGAKMDRTALREALGELFVWPISGRRTSAFGCRNDPFTGVRSYHAAMDIAAPTGTAVRVSSDGRVSSVGYNAVYGNFIIITHSREYQTMYAHLNRVLVKTGSYVDQGTIIARSGNTGRSTGPHLHFAVYKNKRAINPLEVLNQ
jgi:murein DD-endopeptidase MepM/ murein hydrolase activator NlpD